ncbi:MBL fold metallo-hydrolase [Alteromonas gilva]|uniref:3',5'-cyclic-nucleotide phosphodiesterase n=1 Tax=Alteromonas gilva TaxID=2987522 RepID=A0ABT5KZK7_9ALTE|nr:3',5'-cyclic-nucleotide phosphodiesterase [Alteromonas gilva]MDC8830200.1 3',5'-cyclic-nucleotide phosphodiesterase [Alteromonas gilva]
MPVTNRLSGVFAGVLLFGCTASASDFDVVPLGVQGGLNEANLSSYLVSVAAKNQFLALDAGTLSSGIDSAFARNAFAEVAWQSGSPYSAKGQLLRDHIKGYAISHAHVDHIAGLAINATDDAKKPLYGFSDTLNKLRDHLFNWQLWPNFADQGAEFALAKYRYQPLSAGTPVNLDELGMRLTAYPLSHSGSSLSAAFLLQHNNAALLYLGDTGPDSIEKGQQLYAVWQQVAPLVKQNQLKALFIESSYPNSRPDDKLYGHLTPRYVLQELTVLASLVNPEHPDIALKGLKVVITHIKPSYLKSENSQTIIQRELTRANNLGVEFVFAQQGELLHF